MRLMDRSSPALAASIIAAAILTGGCSAAQPITATPPALPSATATPDVSEQANEPVASLQSPAATTHTPKPTPTKTPHRAMPHKTAHRPLPIPTPTRRPARPAARSGVHPGAFCAPQGALGRTTAGTLMRCSSRGGDQARWRRA